MSKPRRQAEAQEVTDPEMPTARSILLWCRCPDPEDKFYQYGLAAMLDRLTTQAKGEARSALLSELAEEAAHFAWAKTGEQIATWLRQKAGEK